MMALEGKANTLGDVYPYRADLRRTPPLLLGFPLPSSLTFDNSRVLLVDAANVAFAGGAPAWEVSDQATIHEETETPLPISTPGTPATVAAPVRSLFQTHSAAVKAVYMVSWGALRPRPIQELTAVAW